MHSTTDTPHYENVPIEVPASWSIIPLEYLATFSGGKTPSMDNKEYWNNGKHLWVTSKDMKSVHITDSLMKISDSALEQMNIYPKGTLLLVTRSGILRHTLPIAILGDEATVNQDIKTISCHFPIINRYLYYAIKAQEQVILEQYHKDGTTVDSIDFDKFKKLPIPLPPIEEQSRIIAEITRLFALVDTIENNQTDLESTIAQTKSKILDLAIHGKLVPQNPNDEPASELLKRINPKAEITCDNGQYGKMPKGWCLVTGASLFKQMKSARPKGELFKYIDIDSIDNKSNIVSSIKEIPTIEAPSRASRYTEKGDVVFSMVRPYLRNIARITENDCIASTGFYICSPYNCMLSKFCYYLMLSNYVVDGLNTFMKGDNSPSITKREIENWLYPLPPMNEQYRIVAKIEEIFTLLDRIELSLRMS